MARMKYKTRKSLPDSAFALPRQRKYPLKTRRGGRVVDSPSHAKNAVARAQQMYERGLLTAAQKKTIDRKAYRMLLKTGSLKTRTARRKAEAAVGFGEFPFTKCMKEFIHRSPRGVAIEEPVMERGSAPRYAPKGARMRNYDALEDGGGYEARQDLHPVVTDYPNDRRDLAMREWGGQVQASREWPGWGGGSQFGGKTKEDWYQEGANHWTYLRSRGLTSAQAPWPKLKAGGWASEAFTDGYMAARRASYDKGAKFGRQWPSGSSEQPGWPGSPGLSSGYGPVFPYVPKPYAQFGRHNPTVKDLYSKWLEGAPLSNTALNKLRRAGVI